MPIFLKIFWLVAVYADALVFLIFLWGAIKQRMPPLSKKASATEVVVLIILIMLAGAGVAWLSFNLFQHLLPLIPLLTRGTLALTFHSIMGEKLSEEAKQRTEYRTVALGLMAITFTSLTALTIVNAQVATMLFLPVYYMLLSFLGLLVVLNMQSYKDYEWVALLGAAFLDFATLCMLLSIISIFLSSAQPALYKYIFTNLALGAWSTDHLIRLYIEWDIYQGQVEDKATPPG